MDKIRKEYTSDEEFTPANAAKASSAAEGLCKCARVWGWGLRAPRPPRRPAPRNCPADSSHRRPGRRHVLTLS